MRPVRLELEGFTSFRRKVELDFSGLDLFAITGSTGAGKTSLIDSILFALYGRTPRIGRGATDLISQGAAETKVLLEFRAGEHLYRAFRYVKRKGATKQRLDQKIGEDWEPLADKSAAMEAKLHELLGLDFDGFTKTVVLPQGEFDRFLRGEASKRREILIELLGLDIYKQMMKAANESASRKSERAKLIEDQWKSTLADLSEERIAELESQSAAEQSRLASLQAELDRINAVYPLQARLRELKTLFAQREQLQGQLAPIASRKQKAAEMFEAAEAAMAGVEEVLEAARVKAQELENADGSPDLLRNKAAEIRKAIAKKGELARSREMLAQFVQEYQKLQEQLKIAYDAAQQAEDAYLQAIQDGAANQLREHLHAGEECPVCEQVVLLVPAPKGGSGIDDARAARESAKKAHEKLQAQANATFTKVKQLETQIKASEGLLADTSESPETFEAKAQAVEAARSAARKAEADVATNRKSLDQARAALTQADTDLQLLSQRIESVAGQLQQGDTVEAIETQLGEYAGRDLDAERRRVTSELQSGQRRVAQLEAAIEQARKRLAEWEERRVEIKELNAQAETARKLGLHLREDRFQTFVLGQTLKRLAAQGTRQLKHLSSNRYSFATDGDEFLVVDHWNADEKRSVNTLSGGESFLASLSLALALSKSLPDFSVNRDSIRLDSLFLDEGFSTLDTETMQIVLDAIELLQADGRMIGVVSHIPELAERLPARIEVSKSPGGSAIAVK